MWILLCCLLRIWNLVGHRATAETALQVVAEFADDSFTLNMIGTWLIILNNVIGLLYDLSVDGGFGQLDNTVVTQTPRGKMSRRF